MHIVTAWLMGNLQHTDGRVKWWQAIQDRLVRSRHVDGTYGCAGPQFDVAGPYQGRCLLGDDGYISLPQQKHRLPDVILVLDNVTCSILSRRMKNKPGLCGALQPSSVNVTVALKAEPLQPAGIDNVSLHLEDQALLRDLSPCEWSLHQFMDLMDR